MFEKLKGGPPSMVGAKVVMKIGYDIGGKL